MCDYLGHEFGAGRYPDSYCIDGSLHDADSDYLNEEDIPCPICRPSDAVAWWACRNRCTGMDDAPALVGARSIVRDIRKNRGLASRLPRRLPSES